MKEELANNIRRNIKYALRLINEKDQTELHDILIHIDTLAQIIEGEPMTATRVKELQDIHFRNLKKRTSQFSGTYDNVIVSLKEKLEKEKGEKQTAALKAILQRAGELDW